MRIQNNVTAMNTHRMYTMNNDAVAASAKKLSSGYRINSAADDAAGLAISEKMRSQIRGLNMATKNSQDAISLVQTAEGALQETQNMLQRMNELAVQAATGTNEDLDRTALAKEFEQLKREINDVAEQTNFNNMKILDGSLSYKGYVRSAATAGVNMTVEQNTKVAEGGISVATTAVAKAETDGIEGKLTLKDWKTTQGVKTEVTDIQIKIDGKDVKVTGDIKDLSATNDDSNKTLDKLFAGKTVTFESEDGIKFTLDAENGVVTTDDKVDFDMSRLSIEVSNRKAGSEYGAGDGTALGGTVYSVDPDTTKTYNGVKTIGGGVEDPTIEVTLDESKMKDGDSIKIGDKTYVFYADKREDKTQGKAYGVGADGERVYESTSGDVINVIYDADAAGHTDAATKFAALIDTDNKPGSTPTVKDSANATANSETKLGTSQNGNTVTIKADVTLEADSEATAAGDPTRADALKVNQDKAEKANAALKTEITSAGSKNSTTTTVEFDVAKMKDGDTFKITAGQAKIEVTYNGESRKDFMQKVDDAVKAAGADGFAEVKGNALIITDKNTKVELDDSWKKQDYAGETNALRIQVGALENEQLSIAIDSMNTASLGLDNSFLAIAGNSNDANIDEAGKAITAVRDAINRVSDQRATLGAMQNRLDHKIANLKTTSENLTASESRIRDVDMAQEMTNFTKNNILSQAATAMLAQANSLPQNVLSLLG